MAILDLSVKLSDFKLKGEKERESITSEVATWESAQAVVSVASVQLQKSLASVAAAVKLN